jgi:alkylation response protein AidB-like acyl-CoA dehydrogenase
MRCFVLSETPTIQTLIEVVPGEEYLLQTNDETRLVSRDLSRASETLAEASAEVASVAFRTARGAVRHALDYARAREEFDASHQA